MRRIAERVEAVNDRPMRGSAAVGRTLRPLDRPALRPLPAPPLCYADWSKAV